LVWGVFLVCFCGYLLVLVLAWGMQMPGVYAKEEIPRADHRDGQRLFHAGTPLSATGAMEQVLLGATREDRIGVCIGIFKEDKVGPATSLCESPRHCMGQCVSRRVHCMGHCVSHFAECAPCHYVESPCHCVSRGVAGV